MKFLNYLINYYVRNTILSYFIIGLAYFIIPANSNESIILVSFLIVSIYYLICHIANGGYRDNCI